MTLTQLNALSLEEFVQLLGGVFEHSPWVASQAWEHRPFASGEDLHAAMCAQVDSAGTDAKLALIRAHPQLAGKAAIRGELTEASASEQEGAGLDRCSPEEYRLLHELNARYEQRFGFPFILAVRGHTRESILAALAARMENSREAEFDEALRQIGRIAELRLAAIIGP